MQWFPEFTAFVDRDQPTIIRDRYTGELIEPTSDVTTLYNCFFNCPVNHMVKCKEEHKYEQILHPIKPVF